MVSKNWTEKAKELRAQGMSYAKIGAAVGKSAECIHYTLNPEARKRRNQVSLRRYYKIRKKILAEEAKYYQDNKEEILKKHVKYKREHRKETAITRKTYRENHGAEHNADEAKRRALRRNVTIVEDKEMINEIFRIAREEKRIRCYLCDKLIPLGQREVDHIIPLINGGKHCASNLAIVHRYCNRSKGPKLPQEIGLLL